MREKAGRRSEINEEKVKESNLSPTQIFSKGRKNSYHIYYHGERTEIV